MDNNTYRTIWISDLHLGSTQCQADVLLDFLKNNESEKLYLVKDIDGFLFVNTGDFVESCTAIVEHVNGTLELVKWRKTESAVYRQETLNLNVHK